MLRVDVRCLRPDNYIEFGLVDYAKGAKPTTPTLFIGAYCKTVADQKWLEKTVKEIVERSKTKKPEKARRKKKVYRFHLQPTKSFRAGAPQRESYDSDATYFAAEKRYIVEWQEKYECAGCDDPVCPQCGTVQV